jgi:hypothetical protein
VSSSYPDTEPATCSTGNKVLGGGFSVQFAGVFYSEPTSGSGLSDHVRRLPVRDRRRQRTRPTDAEGTRTWTLPDPRPV